MGRYVSSRWFLSLIFAFSVALVVTVALRSSKGAGQGQVAQIFNETESLQIEDLKITDPRPGEKQYNFTLRNISDKQIVAWVITFPAGRLTIGSEIGSGLAPGATHNTEVYDVFDGRAGERKITVAMAMFADGASEGDFTLHKRVTDSREGSRIQTERINAIIERALLDKKAGRNKLNGKAWLDQITTAISALPDTGPPDKPAMSMGMNSQKQDAIRLIGYLGGWEESRHSDAVKAVRIKRESAVIFEATDLQDGLSRIVGENKRKIEKDKAERGVK